MPQETARWQRINAASMEIKQIQRIKPSKQQRVWGLQFNTGIVMGRSWGEELGEELGRSGMEDEAGKMMCFTKIL